jgi:hypothetical protein
LCPWRKFSFDGVYDFNSSATSLKYTSGVYDFNCRTPKFRVNPWFVRRSGPVLKKRYTLQPHAFVATLVTLRPHQNRTSDMLYTLQDAPAAINFTQAFWRTLVEVDPGIQAPANNTAGTARGDRFHLQWWTSPDGQYFAAQVLDTLHPSLWEAFAIPALTGSTVAGRRVCWSAGGAASLDTIWQGAFGTSDAPVDAPVLPHVRHPSFIDIVAAGSSTTRLGLVRDENALVDGLKAEVDYWKGLAKALNKAKEEKPQYRPVGQTDSAANQEPTTPDDQAIKWRLRDIDQWAAQNTDRIIILPRAISATKRSPFEAPDLLYACLELLAQEYRLVKLGQADRNTFKVKAESMGLDFGGSVEPSTAGMLRDQYFIRWMGSRRFLDQHLGKGATRDPRFCLRIYFTFCEVEQKVVVGSMPAHLGTSNS